MKKISIVGVEGSGKTVLMSVLGDKYSVPDEDGFFLNPLNRKTYEYCIKIVADMRKGYWPQVTEPGQTVNLQWCLCKANENRVAENLGEVTMMDFAGEIYREAFGGKEVQESSQKDVETLKTYVSQCDNLLLLVNLKDIIDGDKSKDRTIDMLWTSKSIMEYAIKNGVNDIAIAFTQSERYSNIIAECGGGPGTLKKYHSLIAALNPKVRVFVLSAVKETIVNDKGIEVPAQDFYSVGLDELVEWMTEVKVVGLSTPLHEESGDVRDLQSIKKVQLWKDGPYWADRNIGAESPWDSGYYFWWGDTVGYKRVTDKWVASDGSVSNFSFEKNNVPTCRGWFGKSIGKLRRDGWISYLNKLMPNHDAAHEHWGGDWRMPTVAEFVELKDKCDWTWTTVNGVNGYVVRGKGNYSSASIFLPATGFGYEASLGMGISGSDGNYWSSVPSSDSYGAFELVFRSGYRNMQWRYRHGGGPVRPVQEFTK